MCCLQTVAKIALGNSLLQDFKMGSSKTLPLLLVAVFAATAALANEDDKYLIVTSDAIIPGTELAMDVFLIDPSIEDESDSDECVLDLSVSARGYLWYRSDLKIKMDTKRKFVRLSPRIMVPLNASNFGESTELTVESSSCFNLSRTVEIPIRNRELLVSIRTDKLKYNPGDIVFIESLVLSQELRPHYKPVNLYIHTSKGDIVVRWLNITAEKGMIREKYWLPLLAQPDELTITLENYRQQVNHTIEIELPNSPYGKEYFEVQVRSPRYHTLDAADESKSPNLEISVAASLFSGVPVEGEVEVELSLVNSTFSGPLGPTLLQAGHALISLTIDEIKKALEMPAEEPLIGRELKFDIAVEKMTPMPPKKKDGESSEPETKMEEEPEGEEKKEEATEKDKSEEERKGCCDDIIVPVTRVVKVSFVDQSNVLYFTEYTPLYFKPGLSYVGQILLKPVQESLPLDEEDKEVKIKVKFYGPDSETPREEEIKLIVQLNSVEEFTFEVEKEVTKLEIEALLEEPGKTIRAHLKEILPFASGSEEKHMVQVLLNQKSPKVAVGESLKVKVKTTFPVDIYSYRIYSESLLLVSDLIITDSPSTSSDLEVLIPYNVSHLLSSPRLLVGATSPDLEIHYDSLRFVIDRRPEESLTLELKKEVVELGEEIELVVKAEPLTEVFLLAISNPLVFEPKERELRKLIDKEKMSRYLRHMNSTRFTRFMDEYCDGCTTIPSLAPDSIRVINESHGFVLTDMTVVIDLEKSWPSPTYHNGTLDDLEPSNLDTVEEFDSYFFNLNITFGLSSEETIKFVVPKEARLYTIAAFGLRPGRGLVLVDEPVQLTATSEVLASLEHPDIAVRGEEVIIAVHLFNNQDNDVELDVNIYEKAGYTLLCLEEDSGEERKLSEKVSVKSMDTAVVEFIIKISPTTQKPLDISVEISSENLSLNLLSTIEIEYQGYKVEKTKTSLLDNFNGHQELIIDVVTDTKVVVEMSERSSVKIYGHPLGPAIEHVCRELNESSILEERTKMWFILAVNVLEHISNNSLFENSVEVDIEHKDMLLNGVSVDTEDCIETTRDALDYMLHKGNQDGSVSFYPESTGFIWLTTMMLDAIVTLKDIRYADEDDVIKKIEWLVKQQKPDGNFKESEDSIQLRIYPEETDVPLTSKVVAALLHASEKLELPEQISELIRASTEKALNFVLDDVSKGRIDKDLYSLNLAAFALALAKSDKVFEVLNRRDDLASRVKETMDSNSEEPIIGHQSFELEAESYAILTSLAMNDLQGARKHVEFVLGKMKPGGGFITAEDTNTALRALSQYYRLYDMSQEHEQVHIDVSVTLSNDERLNLKILSPLYIGEIYFDESNRTLGNPLTIRSSGEGTMVVQTVLDYNDKSATIIPYPFNLTLETTQMDHASLKVKVCARNFDLDKKNFLIGEVPILTGYDLNIDSILRQSNPQVLKQDDTIYITFHNVDPFDPQCAELLLEKVYPVKQFESRFGRLYSIQDPAFFVFATYPENPLDKMVEYSCSK